jgi:hypothetical protein
MSASPPISAAICAPIAALDRRVTRAAVPLALSARGPRRPASTTDAHLTTFIGGETD